MLLGKLIVERERERERCLQLLAWRHAARHARATRAGRWCRGSAGVRLGLRTAVSLRFP